MDKNKKRVLFIEDEEHLQRLASSALKDAGYEALRAYDGETGIRVLEEKRPDLVLLDLILPKKDGFDVLEYMKSKDELKNIPVIILSNLEEKYDMDKALALGANSYLVKTNYELSEIIEKVNEVLGT
ncbi:response regulator [Patescibacteria group bacterium]